MRISKAVFIFLLVAACASTDPNRSPNNGRLDPKTSPTTSPHTEAPDPSADLHLDDYGPAPELTNQIWLNSDQALRLEDLRGQVVLIEMWTFG